MLPIFIFDKHILDDLESSDARISFIHSTLQRLKDELEALGSTLQVFYDTPEHVFEHIDAKAVYTNHDYEPYARKRDAVIKKNLDERGIPFHSFKDQVLFEKDEIVKPDGTPYSIYTPYKNRWREALSSQGITRYAIETVKQHLVQRTPLPMITLEDMGFTFNEAIAPDIGELPVDIINNYHQSRDFPAKHNGTTRLGIHLRFGTISIRQLIEVAMKHNSVYLNELIWREFYMMILWHHPRIVEESFKPAYDRIAWRNDEEEFKRWCTGTTGVAMVDAGMRELNETGHMHNRSRMIVASFLTKNLLIDWRWGAAYFADKLLDYELASNNGGWQWAAGSGCDAAPYFRIFNPTLQGKKFDPQEDYIKKWVPEYQDVNYTPMVDLKMTKNRAIDTYKNALNTA